MSAIAVLDVGKTNVKLTAASREGELLETVHKTFNFSMAALVLAHAGAALKHHLVDHDDVLVRMLPMLKKP